MTGGVIGEKKDFSIAQFSIEFLQNIRPNPTGHPSIHAAVVWQRGSSFLETTRIFEFSNCVCLLFGSRSIAQKKNSHSIFRRFATSRITAGDSESTRWCSFVEQSGF